MSSIFFHSIFVSSSSRADSRRCFARRPYAEIESTVLCPPGSPIESFDELDVEVRLPSFFAQQLIDSIETLH